MCACYSPATELKAVRHLLPPQSSGARAEHQYLNHRHSARGPSHLSVILTLWHARNRRRILSYLNILVISSAARKLFSEVGRYVVYLTLIPSSHTNKISLPLAPWNRRAHTSVPTTHVQGKICTRLRCPTMHFHRMVSLD